MARAASVLSDGMVLALTLKKTYSKLRQRVGLASQDSVLGTLLRDGKRRTLGLREYRMLTFYPQRLSASRAYHTSTDARNPHVHFPQSPLHNEHYWDGNCQNDGGK